MDKLEVKFFTDNDVYQGNDGELITEITRCIRCIAEQVFNDFKIGNVLDDNGNVSAEWEINP